MCGSHTFIGKLIRAPIDLAKYALGEVTGANAAANAAEEAARKQAKQQKAQFEEEQALAEEERRRAALEAQRVGSGAERRATGRSSTLLTSPSGVMGGGTTARSQLLPG